MDGVGDPADALTATRQHNKKWPGNARPFSFVPDFYFGGADGALGAGAVGAGVAGRDGLMPPPAPDPVVVLVEAGGVVVLLAVLVFEPPQ